MCVCFCTGVRKGQPKSDWLQACIQQSADAFFGCLADLSTPLGQSDKSTARQEEELLKESLKSVSKEEARD